jgi:hypothetical protein
MNPTETTNEGMNKKENRTCGFYYFNKPGAKLCHKSVINVIDYPHVSDQKDNEISFYCVAHTCIVDGCYDIIKGGVTNLCRNHTCRESDCSDPVFDFSKLCFNHLCHIKGCKSKVIENSNFCKVHCCGIKECKDTSYPKDFCEFHACKVEFCSQEHLPGSPYCHEHTCLNPTCDRGVDNGENYCSFHRCAVDGCENMLYCIKHCESHREYDLNCPMCLDANMFCRHHS